MFLILFALFLGLRHPRNHPQIDFPLGEREADELLFETGRGEDRVDSLEKGALVAVVQRTVNARKCSTKGGLIGEGEHNSDIVCCRKRFITPEFMAWESFRPPCRLFSALVIW